MQQQREPMRRERVQQQQQRVQVLMRQLRPVSRPQTWFQPRPQPLAQRQHRQP